MKVLRSGQHRKKHPVFASWTRDKETEAIQGIAKVMRNAGRRLFVYCISRVAARSAAPVAKREAYLALVMYVIDDVTEGAAQPVLCFDSERQSTLERVVHEWASNVFRDTQYCDLFPFLSKGIVIPEPQFVKPASHPCLELADFVAYIVARYHLERWQGRPPTLDPSMMGRVTYLGFQRSGTLVYSIQEGFPWELLYGTGT